MGCLSLCVTISSWLCVKEWPNRTLFSYGLEADCGFYSKRKAFLSILPQPGLNKVCWQQDREAFCCLALCLLPPAPGLAAPSARIPCVCYLVIAKTHIHSLLLCLLLVGFVEIRLWNPAIALQTLLRAGGRWWGAGNWQEFQHILNIYIPGYIAKCFWMHGSLWLQKLWLKYWI